MTDTTEIDWGRDGDMSTNKAGDWQECWNTSDGCGLDIVKYRILGEEK